MELLVFAGIRMGISDEVIYSLSPKRFYAMRSEWSKVRYEENRNWALLRMDVINFSICRPRESVSLQDLLGGSDLERADTNKPRNLTKRRRGEIAASLRRLFSSLETPTE